MAFGSILLVLGSVVSAGNFHETAVPSLQLVGWPDSPAVVSDPDFGVWTLVGIPRTCPCNPCRCDPCRCDRTEEACPGGVCGLGPVVPSRPTLSSWAAETTSVPGKTTVQYRQEAVPARQSWERRVYAPAPGGYYVGPTATFKSRGRTIFRGSGSSCGPWGCR
jgi:hypothetical protein